MRVGFVGLGKLGLPVATILAARGHEVSGYDPQVSGFPSTPDAQEAGWEEQIKAAEGRFSFGTLEDACRSDVLFCAVQTPHDPAYEGISPLPATRRDFDYGYLRSAIRDIRTVCENKHLHPLIVVISTVLPGTMRREIIPPLGRLRLVYNPAFIAMGTTVRDFIEPEFILLGGATADTDQVMGVYRAAEIDAPFRRMSIESAELAKVAYNVSIGMKLAVANTLGELCHKVEGANIDSVTWALKAADRRIVSTAYMDAGMGDGGSCHPRDLIALSWLARERNLSYDLFESVMLQRQEHARWLAEMMVAYADGRPLGILGIAYKPRSALTAGSPALLVRSLLPSDPVLIDPYVEAHNAPMPTTPHVWLVGTRHPEFPHYDFPAGSVVIDPWRYIPDRFGVEVIRVGS